MIQDLNRARKEYAMKVNANKTVTVTKMKRVQIQVGNEKIQKI